MFSFSSRPVRAAATALFAIAVSASPLVAGPPWISIELPGNPFDSQARDAFLIVHAFHHGEPVEYPVSGVAEGMVNGQRKSIPLTFQKTQRPGAFAVKKQWTDGSVWVLSFTVSQGRNDVASALVTIAPDGHAARVQTLTRAGAAGNTLPRAIDRADVDAAFKAARANTH